MKPYKVTVHFLNTNKRKQFSATFENIGAARTFVSYAPVTCVNFILVDAEDKKEIERHRFEQLPLKPHEEVSEPLPMGSVNEWVDQIKQTHPENEITPHVVAVDPMGLALSDVAQAEIEARERELSELPEEARAQLTPPPEAPVEPVIEMMTQQQQRALFGVVIPEYAKQKKISLRDAQLQLKDLLVKRNMIKSSRTELTKADASKVIDGMCKALHLELDSSWQ